MLRQILLAGLAGGVIVFFFSAAQNALLPGVEPRPLPAESALLPLLRTSIPQPGFYFFPGGAITRNMSRAERAAAQAQHDRNFKEGPTGVLVYRSGGEDFQFGRRLAVQFLLSLIAATVAAVILARTAGAAAYPARVGIVALLGVFAFAYLEPQYWNWYGFPGAYTIARIVGGVGGWTAAGLAMAAIVRPS
jgi:hypothetical protein